MAAGGAFVGVDGHGARSWVSEGAKPSIIGGGAGLKPPASLRACPRRSSGGRAALEMVHVALVVRHRLGHQRTHDHARQGGQQPRKLLRKRLGQGRRGQEDESGTCMRPGALIAPLMATERAGSTPPPAPAEAPPVSPALIAPSLVRRMACWVYEGLLLFAVVFVAGWLFSTLGQSARRHGRSPAPVAGLPVRGFRHLLQPGSGPGARRSAMKTWKIRVVDRLGRPLSQPRALLRYACSWLWFLPALAALAPFKPSAGESGGPVAGLGRRLGPAEPLSPAAPVLARRAGGHAAGAGGHGEPPLKCVGDNAAMSAPRQTLFPCELAEDAHRPEPDLACRRLFARRPAGRLGRDRVSPGNAGRRRAAAAGVLAGARLDRNGTAGRFRADRDDRRAAQHRPSKPSSIASAPNGTTCPNAPRTWAAPRCC